MKLINYSLAALMAVGISSFASDNLADAFQNGSVSGEIRAFYFDRDYGTGSPNTDADILNFAFRLSYVTDTFYGFRLGGGFQTQHSPYADDAAKREYRGTWDMYGSGAVLSEAYLGYTFSKTDIKLGRQYLNMPLMRSDGSRIILQAFEGVSVISNELPDTTLMAAYVTKLQDRTSGDGDIPDFEKLPNGGDYGYVFGIENKSISDLKLTLAYGEQDKSHSMTQIQADYTPKIGDYTYTLGAQYFNTDYDDSTTHDSNIYAVKAGIQIGNFSTYVAYAEIEDGNSMFGIVGTDDKPSLYTSAKLEAGLYNESEQYAVDTNYMIAPINLLVGARYVNVDYETNEEVDYSGVYAAHEFRSGPLKGFSTVVLYEQADSNIEANDKDEFRLRLIYSF